MAEEEKTDVLEQQPAESASPAVEPRRRVRGRQVSSGVVHIDSTYNNTRVVITDQQGNVIAWSTGGKLGFKGSRKSTAYVAQMIAGDAAKKAISTYGLREVEVQVKGAGNGRESAVRGIAAAGLEISLLRDVTPLPHNGCRPPKRRRV
ncbi:MAG: 30S ribosomal protein S11 [Lentisphaeria bacterium]|jgi:small subunit ribosomal protein S11|nr:30S ribosomal protein S11 [Lentisphaeria bacterium]MDY0175881.1 30S ribosomal protein S11 [Lentisphaeria bacterium]NLZ59670.1 30S ribosomal protein S11 [Lentisphaerota bacterium]